MESKTLDVYTIQSTFRVARGCFCFHNTHYTAATHEKAIFDGIRWTQQEIIKCGARRVTEVEILLLTRMGPILDDGDESVRYARIFNWNFRHDLPLEEFSLERIAGHIKRLSSVDPVFRAHLETVANLPT